MMSLFQKRVTCLRLYYYNWVDTSSDDLLNTEVSSAQ